MQGTTVSYFGASREKILRLGLSEEIRKLAHLVAGELDDVDMGVPDGALHVPSVGRHASSARFGVSSLLYTRKELLVSRVLRLRNAILTGSVDVGAIIVLNDPPPGSSHARVATRLDLIRVIKYDLPEASRVPIIVLAIGDGPIDVNGITRSSRRLAAAITAYAKQY